MSFIALQAYRAVSSAARLLRGRVQLAAVRNTFASMVSLYHHPVLHLSAPRTKQTYQLSTSVCFVTLSCLLSQ